MLLLKECAKVSQGVILSRIKTIATPDAISIPLYTMKEMNESLGLEYRGSTEKLQEIHVLKQKINDLPMTHEGMVLINLTSHRAVAVRSDHVGKLIPSNFAIIEPSELVNSDYLEWYFNEHPSCRKQMMIATQGTTVAALSIQMLRLLLIELPPVNHQKTISTIYRCMDRKRRLMNERIELEEKLMKQLLLDFLKEEDKSDTN